MYTPPSATLLSPFLEPNLDSLLILAPMSAPPLPLSAPFSSPLPPTQYHLLILVDMSASPSAPFPFCSPTHYHLILATVYAPLLSPLLSSRHQLTTTLNKYLYIHPLLPLLSPLPPTHYHLLMLALPAIRSCGTITYCMYACIYIACDAVMLGDHH